VLVPDAFESVPERYSSDAPRLIEKFPDETFVKTGDDVRGPVPRAFYSMPERLNEMTSEGIDVEVISVFPYTFGYQLEVEEAKLFSRCQNDAIHKIAKENPDHFYGFATVPLQDPVEAVKEMERAMGQLHMVGVLMGSNINDMNLDDETLSPFFKRAEELSAFLLIHPINVLGASRMSNYYLPVLVGNPSDTSLAIASMIYGGVFDDFPNLKVCFAHGGGFLPYQLGRLDRGFMVRKEPRKVIDRPPSSYLKNILMDTILYEKRALQFMVDRVGAQNVLLGSDSPLDMHDHDVVAKVRDLGITESDKEMILGGNAQRLLPGIRNK